MRRWTACCLLTLDILIAEYIERVGIEQACRLLTLDILIVEKFAKKLKIKKLKKVSKKLLTIPDSRHIITEHGSLVKRLRRRPLTAETGVRFPYELFGILDVRIPHRITEYGSLVKRLRRRPLTAETGVRFPYELSAPEDSGAFFLQKYILIFRFPEIG